MEDICLLGSGPKPFSQQPLPLDDDPYCHRFKAVHEEQHRVSKALEYGTPKVWMSSVLQFYYSPSIAQIPRHVPQSGPAEYPLTEGNTLSPGVSRADVEV